MSLFQKSKNKYTANIICFGKKVESRANEPPLYVQRISHINKDINKDNIQSVKENDNTPTKNNNLVFNQF